MFSYWQPSKRHCIINHKYSLTQSLNRIFLKKPLNEYKKSNKTATHIEY